MKKILVIISLLFPIQALTQDIGDKKAVYYFLDPKTPTNASLWTMEYDAPYKLYTIECPCLPGNGKPMLAYNENTGLAFVSRKDLKKLHTINIKELITLSKKILVNIDDGYDVYLIVPINEKFRIYKTRLSITQRQSFTDYEIFPHIDTSKHKQ